MKGQKTVKVENILVRHPRMEDTGPKSECVNCALLVNSVDERNMVDMALVTTFLIPGVFFLGIALR